MWHRKFHSICRKWSSAPGLGRPKQSPKQPWLDIQSQIREGLSFKDVSWKSPKLHETPFFLSQKIKCCVSSYQKVESLLPRSQIISGLLPLPCHLSNPESKLFSKNYLRRSLVLLLFFADYFIILFKSFLHWLPPCSLSNIVRKLLNFLYMTWDKSRTISPSDWLIG